MGRRKTLRSELQARAVERDGYVTSQDADRLGMPVAEFDRLVAEGRLTTVSAGLYRLDRMPPGRHCVLAEALLRLGADAFLSHDAVLALHGLTEQEPDRIRIGLTSPRRRRRAPQGVELVRDQVPADELTCYQGLRSTTVLRALLDCRRLLPPAQLAAAAELAARRGLLLRRERSTVLSALEPALA